MKKKFDFGENWKNFALNSLNDSKFIEAKESLARILGSNNIKGKSFLDIGAGSGIFSIAADKLGASKVVGFDISKNSIDTCYLNKDRFTKNRNIEFYQQSIISDGYDKSGKFDIVYSWGVLHHTGNMWEAIDNSMKLVKDNGVFVIAIYNKHWSSYFWKAVKILYNISPKWIQKIMVFKFYWIIALAKFLVTGKNPFTRNRRGMDYYYNIIDWIGGYPYEYASKNQIINYFKKNNFDIVCFNKAYVPTGCNEFVFKKVV